MRSMPRRRTPRCYPVSDTLGENHQRDRCLSSAIESPATRHNAPATTLTYLFPAAVTLHLHLRPVQPYSHNKARPLFSASSYRFLTNEIISTTPPDLFYVISYNTVYKGPLYSSQTSICASCLRAPTPTMPPTSTNDPIAPLSSPSALYAPQHFPPFPTHRRTTSYSQSHPQHSQQPQALAGPIQQEQKVPYARVADVTRGGASDPTASTPFLRDFNLVAEAAKRAQMAVLMRDLGDLGV